MPTQPPVQPPRTSTPVPVSRGIKREFEDSSLALSNTQGTGPGSAAVGTGGVSPTLGQQQRPGVAKAGVPGARPRPVKKQRVVSNDFTLLYPKSRRVWERCDPVDACPCVNLRCHGWRHLTHCFGGYFGSPELLLLTLVHLPPTGHTRPSERHASPSANTAAYSAGCIILPGVAFCSFLKCCITISRLALTFGIRNASVQPRAI